MTWIAYQSNESGRLEVYVAPFPGPGGKHQISVKGGTRPRWRRDGHEIFYYDPGNMVMAAEVTKKGGCIEVGATQKLFGPVPTNAWYDVSADGKQFLERVPEQNTSSPPLTLIQNWVAALKN
jgi:hypothetical protein